MDSLPIMVEEVRHALCRMKNGKAVGEDGMSAEMMRALDDLSLEVLTDITNKIYDSGIILSQMSRSIFANIPKKEGKIECAKYRTLSIMSQIAKIFL